MVSNVPGGSPESVKTKNNDLEQNVGNKVDNTVKSWSIKEGKF